jgi:hypothetical protein
MMASIKNTQTFTSVLQISTGISTNLVNSTVNGSVSGTIIFNQPFQGPTYKKIVAYANALNGTSVITFPVPFTYPPTYMTNSDGLQSDVVSITTTQANLSSSGSTGFFTFEGF